MIDTFAALREEAAERADLLENECFVCGFKRSTYDDLGLTHGPTFDMHRDNDHNMWMYAFYVVYLRR
jgi:inositol 1,4,5-triphosphate receptor type 1/inositol 1,4,5-triphosphate receptor type 3